MTGGHEIGPKLLSIRPEFPELQPGVAHDAGIRGSPGQVFVRKVIDNAVKVTFEIKSVKRNVKMIGDPAGVAGVLSAAAPFLMGRGRVFRLVSTRAHEKADNLVALLLEQTRSHGAIHSTAHR